MNPSAPPVLACYLAVDTSDSMSGPALQAAGIELARIWDAVRAHPGLAAGCRLAVVTFDGQARVQVPLGRPADLGRAPRLAVTRPGTDYQGLFRLLAATIAADAASLRARGLRPLRPAVVVLTDGRPGRDAAPPAPTDAAPIEGSDLVAFGFGSADSRPVGTVAAVVSLLLASLRAGRAAQAPSARAASTRAATSSGLDASVDTTTSATSP